MKYALKKILLITGVILTSLSTISPVFAETQTTTVYQSFYSITVNMTATGNMASRNKEFAVNIQLPASCASRTFTATKTADNESAVENAVTADSTGKISVSLYPNEKILIEGLSKAEIETLKTYEHFSVNEDNYSSDGYTTTYTASQNEGNLAVTVTNSRQSHVPSGSHIATGVAATCLIAIFLLGLLTVSKRTGGEADD